MSASLVGSEMCIRDRCWLHPLGTCWPPRASATQLAHMPTPAGIGMVWAVSYTHLTLPTICSV
eukprot:1888447-Alexandrium_andersonii.AAC.1